MARCTCVKEIEDGLKEKGYKDADLVDTGFFIGDKGMTWATVSNIEYVDGQTKSGKDRIKQLPIRHEYCPFCGKKYE